MTGTHLIPESEEDEKVGYLNVRLRSEPLSHNVFRSKKNNELYITHRDMGRIIVKGELKKLMTSIRIGNRFSVAPRKSTGGNAPKQHLPQSSTEKGTPKVETPVATNSVNDEVQVRKKRKI